jgi:hypothetical protein
LALAVAGGLDGRAAGGQPDRERGSWPGRSGLGELVAAQGLTGGPGGIEGVGLGAVAAGGPLGPVQLHHTLLVGGQEPGQAGAVAAGALDRPHPPPIVLVGQLQEPLVAVQAGGHGQGGHALAGTRDHNRRGVGVLVSVDADDDLDESASMCIALAPCPDADVVGAGPGRSTAGL